MRTSTPPPAVTQRRVFGRGSPVLDYWLAHSEGFELATARGGSRGVVEEVVIDERGQPRALVVRGAVLGRPHLVDPGSVEAVVPAERTITLMGDGRRLPGPEGGVPFVRAAVDPAARVARVLLVLLAQVARWFGRRARRDAPVIARRTGRAAAASAAWARPRLGALVRLVATAAVAALVFVATLVQALLVAAAGFGRLVAQEWRQRRAAPRPGR